MCYLCFWFISLNMISSDWVPFAANGIISSFYRWVIFYSVYIPHFLFSFLWWLTPSLIPHFGCCEQSCYKLGGAGISLVYCIQTLQSIPNRGIARLYGKSIFSFLRSVHTVSHSDCTHLHSHQQCINVPKERYFVPILL